MFHIKDPVLAAVALDEDSREILAQAESLARAHKVDLYICHVLPEIFAVRPLFPQFQLGDALSVSQLESSVCSALYQCMLEASIRDPSQVEILIEHGTAHAGILRAMGRVQAGAIVVGGQLPTNGSQFLGKTAEAVVRYADCPVWVARPRRTGVVLAATDFSDPSLPVVDVAAAVAQCHKLDLAIIHAVDPVPIGLRAYGEFAGLPLMAFRNQMKEVLQQKLDDIVVRFNARGGGHLRDGPAASAILKAVSQLPAQLLVIGSQGRTGLRRVALGSVAEAVVRAAPCSTLVIRRKPRSEMPE